MRPLTLPMDPDRSTDAAPAAARSAAFLAAARPALDRAYRLAGLILSDAAEAEDAVQDALAVAWQSFDGLRERDRFGPWLDRIVVNGCRDRLRRRRIVRFVPIEAGGDPAGGDPFRVVLQRDELLGGLAALTDDERIVVVLRFWADLPLEGIAERTGWPLGSVKSRLHRALRRLRETLDARDREDRR